MHVLVALELPGESLDGVANARDAIWLDAGHGRTIGHAGAAEADAGLALGKSGNADDGEIAVPARDLAERDAPGDDGKATRRDQLIARSRRRQHALLELARR